MNRRGFLGLILGTTVGALFLKATTRPEPVAVPKGPVWITDPNCPDDTIYLVHGDVVCPRTPGALDVYSADGTYRGIY